MFRNLVLSGGSVKGVTYIGVLRFLEERGIISQFKNLIGSSVGALVCFFVAIGLNSFEIEQLIKVLFKEYMASSPNVENIINIFHTMGLDDGSIIMETVSKALHNKYNIHDITFIELAKKSGRNLVVCGTNLYNSSSVYFNVDKYPNMSVLKAIRISISIPFIMTPIVYEGAMYADAALFNNFPIDYFDGSLPQNTLGVLIKPKKKQFEPANMNIVTYISCLIDAHFFKMNDFKDDAYKNNKVVEISLDNNSTYHFDFKKFKFDLNSQEIDNFIATGYEAIKLSFG